MNVNNTSGNGTTASNPQHQANPSIHASNKRSAPPAGYQGNAVPAEAGYESDDIDTPLPSLNKRQGGLSSAEQAMPSSRNSQRSMSSLSCQNRSGLKEGLQPPASSQSPHESADNPEADATEAGSYPGFTGASATLHHRKFEFSVSVRQKCDKRKAPL